MSDRAVYRLANAVLLQAVQDAASSSAGRRASALRWMNTRTDSGFSFSLVCRIVNRDPAEVRRFCEQKAAERITAEQARIWWHWQPHSGETPQSLTA